MKQNLKDDTLPRKSMGLLALIAVLALGISAVAYDEVHQKMSAGEQDMVLIDKLNEVARVHVLLGQIGGGHIDEAKQVLRMKIAVDQVEMKRLVAASSPKAAAYAQCVMAQIDRYQKAHPDYYLASSPSSAPEKIKVVQTDQQVAASRLINQ